MGNFLRGTDGSKFIIDLILLASIVGIPILVLKKILEHSQK